MNTKNQKAISQIAEASDYADIENILLDCLKDVCDIDLKIVSKDNATKFDPKTWSYVSISSDYILVIKTVSLTSELKNTIQFLLPYLKIKIDNLALQDKKDFYKRCDCLTGLQTIDSFRESMKDSYEENKDRLNALVILNIHRFKVFNDSYGYEVGNSLLCHISEQITLLLGYNSSIVARTYGDEFAFFLPDVESREAVISLVTSIRNIIEIPICVEEHLIHININIGVVFSDSMKENDTSEDLMRYANVALGFAKENYFDKLHVFDRLIMSKIQRDLYLDTEINTAIYMNNFHLVYQPIISTDNITLIGVEALIRWNHKTQGMISPAEFIPLAEKTGQIFEIEKFVLRSACEFMGKCYFDAKAKGIEHIAYASVNISGQQLAFPGFVDSVLEVLESTGLPPEYLCLEVTETALMKFPDTAIKVLKHLCDLGIKTSIDDFGTGYSSLAYLSKFKVDTLKIDGSFINSLSQTEEAKAIVQSILSLAKTLNLHVIAEGVEDLNQIMILKQLGGVSLQGYYFSKPLDADVAERYIVESLTGSPFIPDINPNTEKKI